jgi:hypothetical protein
MDEDRTLPNARQRLLLRLSLLFNAPLGAVSLPGCLASGMMFDAPGSGDSGLTVALFWGMVALPLFAIGGLISANKAMLDYTTDGLVGAYLLPGVWIAYTGIVLYLIETQCGGSFSCP